MLLFGLFLSEFTFSGPNKTLLQTMLAKLEGEEEIPPPPSAPAPPIPGNQTNISLPNSSPFRDDVAPLGNFNFFNFILIVPDQVEILEYIN